MRKTLTAIVVVLAAGSLAACKMPWDKAETPPPATAATPNPETVETTTATSESTKPADQTAAIDPSKTTETSKTPAAPATK